MFLRISLPDRIFLATRVSKVKAEGPLGGFCLLPRHVDFVSSLVPGLFSYVPEQDAAQQGGQATPGKETFLALDRGLLVKQGDDVLVACANAAKGELGELEDAVREMTRVQSEQERKSRTSIARLEANFVRRFVGFDHG